MGKANAVIHPAWHHGPVNRRVFGSFVEHMGRCVYTGIFEPDHPSADEHGFRQDVAELVREMGVTLVRYPGGNFVSGYRWEDGVGPKEERPTRLDYGWRSIEPNEVGTNEFLAWCERMGIEPMLAVNLGSRGMSEAMEYLEYVNGEQGTELADRRVDHGYERPWNVGIWCLGNEMDGPWQVGHRTAHEYARLSQEVANVFHRFDDTLELVACGSSNRQMPTFGTWEREVLEHTFDYVSNISAHAYYEPIDGDVVSFLCAAEDMDRFIASVRATADHVAAVKQSTKRITVSFDEWNVWYQSRFGGENSIEIQHAPRLIEDTYSVLDAVVVGSFLITLVNRSRDVGMACQAQLANIIAPIRSEPGGPAWRQTIFYPFALTSKYAKGTVLDIAMKSPTIDTPAYGEVPQLWATATLDDDGQLALFVVNRSLDDACELNLDFSALGDVTLVEHLLLHEDDHSIVNSQEHPDAVQPHMGEARVEGGRLTAELPAVSWHCIRLQTSQR